MGASNCIIPLKTLYYLVMKLMKEFFLRKKMNKFPLGNCSEVDAVNKALNAGAKLEHLHLTTLDVKRKNIRKHNIVGKCSCKNCTATFKGRVKKNNTEWED